MTTLFPFIIIIQVFAIIGLFYIVYKANKELKHYKKQFQLCHGELHNVSLKGSHILHHKRPKPHQLADPIIEVVIAEGQGLAFTDAEWKYARQRYGVIKHELPQQYKQIK